MRSFGVEFADEDIEAFLLLQAVEARRSGSFLLQREVHALVPAVLLRMPRLDPFDRDAEPEPPYRELGDIEQGVGLTLRQAVSDDARSAVEGAVEGRFQHGEIQIGGRRLQVAQNSTV